MRQWIYNQSPVPCHWWRRSRLNMPVHQQNFMTELVCRMWPRCSSIIHWHSHCIAVMQHFSHRSIIALDNCTPWQVVDFPQFPENTVPQICAELLSILIKEIPEVFLTARIACKFLSVKGEKSTKSPWADILTAALFLILILWGLSVSHICSGAEAGTSSLVLVKCHFHVPALPQDRLNLYFVFLKLQVFPVSVYRGKKATMTIWRNTQYLFVKQNL